MDDDIIMNAEEQENEQPVPNAAQNEAEMAQLLQQAIEQQNQPHPFSFGAESTPDEIAALDRDVADIKAQLDNARSTMSRYEQSLDNRDGLDAQGIADDAAHREEAYKRTIQLEREYQNIRNQRDIAAITAKTRDIITNRTAPTGFSSEVVFSDPLLNAIDHLASVTSAAHDSINETFNQIAPAEQIDIRDFYEMLNLDHLMSPDEASSYAADYINDYLSGDPAMRKKCLDEFYDGIDAVDVFALDLSCLQGNDTGERSGPDNLTDSERDFLKLLSLFRANQSIAQKAIENPGYLEQRYNTPESRLRHELTQSLLLTQGFASYISLSVLPHNNYMGDLSKNLSANNISMPDTSMAADIAMQAYRQNMATLMNVNVDRSLKFTFPQELSQDLYRNLHSENGNPDLHYQFSSTLNTVLESSVTKQYIAETGISKEDMIFIDGKSLREIGQEKYRRMNANERSKRLENDTMLAMLSGEHRIEIATLQTDHTGALSVQISEVQPDFHCLDQLEKENEHNTIRKAFDFGLTKIETRADKADKLWEKDPDKKARQRSIREKLSGRVFTEANHKKEAEFRSENNLRELEQRLSDYENQEIAHATELKDLTDQQKNAQQRIRDIEARNLPLEQQIGVLLTDRHHAESYTKAIRRVDNITAHIDTLTGTQNPETDVLFPQLDSLIGGFPFDFDKTVISNVQATFKTSVKPAFSALEFAETLANAQTAQERENIIKKAFVIPKSLEGRIDILSTGSQEQKEELLTEMRENLKTGLRDLTNQYRVGLEQYPHKDLITPEAVQQRDQQITLLQSQLEPVPNELRIQSIEAEALVLDGRELYGDVPKLDDARIDYQPPKTREEALNRIVEIDARNALTERYLNEQEHTIARKFLFAMASDPNQPSHLTRQDLRDTLNYIQSMQLPFDCLPSATQNECQQLETVLQNIAAQPLSDPIPDNFDETFSAYFSACLMTVDAKPEYAPIAQDITHAIYSNGADKLNREHLMKDLRAFDKEERLTRMAQERNIVYPPAPTRSAVDLSELSGHQQPKNEQHTRSASVSRKEPQIEEQQPEKRGRSNSI